MKTIEFLHTEAEKRGIPMRSLEQVKTDFAALKARSTPKNRVDVSMARLALLAGRLTDEARAWIASEYPQKGK